MNDTKKITLRKLRCEKIMLNDWVLEMFVSSFSFNKLAFTYFYLNVQMFDDFLNRTKLNSIVILMTESVFKFGLYMIFSLRKKN